MGSPSLTKIQAHSISEWETQTSGLALTVTLVDGSYLWIEQALETTDTSITSQLTEMTIERAEGAGTIIVIDPASGEYQNTQTVILSTNNLNGTIYYTIDGSDPDSTSTEYTGPFPAGNFTAKAIVYEAGVADSDIFSQTYTIENDTITFNIASGKYMAGTIIELSTNNPDLDIYYTTDDSVPDNISTEYTSPFPVGNFTVKAVAYFNGQINSEIASETYTIGEAFQRWRVLFPTFNGGSSTYNGAGMEWFFYNKNQAGLDLSAATIISSGDHSAYPVTNLYSRTTAYHQFNNTGWPYWIEIEFNTQQTIASIVFQASLSSYSFPYMFSAFTLQYDSTGSGDWTDCYSETGLTWISGELKEYILEDGIFNPPAKVDNINIEAAMAEGSAFPSARVARQACEIVAMGGVIPAPVNITNQISEIVLSGLSLGVARPTSQVIEIIILKVAETSVSAHCIEIASLAINPAARVTNFSAEVVNRFLTNEGRVTAQTLEIVSMASAVNTRVSNQVFEVAVGSPTLSAVNTTNQAMEVVLSGDSEPIAKITRVFSEVACFYFRLVRSTIEPWRNTPNTVVWSGGEIEHEGIVYRTESGHYVLPENNIDYYIYFDPDNSSILQVSNDLETIPPEAIIIRSARSDGIQITYVEYETTSIVFPINGAAIISWAAGKIAYNGVIYDIEAGQFAFPEANVAYYIYFSPDHPNTLQVASESDFVLSGNAILAIVYLRQTEDGTEILMESRIAEKPCVPIIAAYIGVLGITDMYVGDLRVQYPSGIDPCGEIMGNDCCRIIARKLTHGSWNRYWDLAPYRFSGPVNAYLPKWHIMEFSGVDYEIGDVSSSGELIGLPDIFESIYAYDGYMILVVCTNMDPDIGPWYGDIYYKARNLIPYWESDEEHCVQGG